MSLLLPDDVWSTSVFPYLDYQSMLRCSEVCQQFLHSVVPNVKELVIDDAHHMHPVPAHKFQGVERLDIRSYATFVEHKIRVCGETADRFVPFIAYFPKLKYVRICGDDADKIFGRRQECQGLWLKNCWGNMEIVHTLIMTVCRAYYRGVISQNTKIFGMFDDVSLQDVQRYLHGHLLGDWDAAIGGYGPMSVAQYSPYEPGCRFCTSICSTIPVDQALLLCCPKNREDIFIDLSFCLLSPEKVSIFISRPGGWEGYIKMFKGIYSKENIKFDSISRGGEGRTFLCDADGTPNLDGNTKGSAFEGISEMLRDLITLIQRHGFPPCIHSEQYTIESLFAFAATEEVLTTETFDALCTIGLPLKRKFFILVDDEYLLDEDGWSHPEKDYYELGQEFTAEDLARMRRTHFQN